MPGVSVAKEVTRNLEREMRKSERKLKRAATKEAAQAQLDALLSEDMARFYADPLGFVMYAYPWDTDPSLRLVKLPDEYRLVYDSEYGPDQWACDLLYDIGRQVRDRNFDGRNAVDAIREAVVSGHGIGKSAFVAWVVDWIMSTRPFARGVVTANTAPQLETKTWAEIAKWTKRCITGHWFEVTTGKGSMKMVHKQHSESWFCSAQTSREENSESFAGLHAANSTPFYIFDEASAIPNKIWEVAEGGMTDGEPMFFVFGNGTRNSGAFFDCFNRFRHRWNGRHVDSREVQITNKEQIAKWIEDHGVDSDFVKIRVRGMFPSLSSRQYISTDAVDEGFGKILPMGSYEYAPVILTCDPAWEGDDDLVIAKRQGLHFEILKVMPKNSNDVAIAGMIAQYEDRFQADAVFIDFGYGTGIKSAGDTMGRSWTLIDFSWGANDQGYLNKRAEMWGLVEEWLREGGALPKDMELYYDLITPESVPRLDGKRQLEPKNVMKKRTGRSPNKGDALALSFAFPVLTRLNSAVHHQRTREKADEYDPMAAFERTFNR